jgi:hypothetical protein
VWYLKFRKIIAFLNKIKHMDIIGDRHDGISAQEKEYIESIKGQNPYGILGLIMGGVSFAFGPQYGFIPVFTIIFCIVTYFTYDKDTEDNPWTFYLGLSLSSIGLYMFIVGKLHHLIL